MKPVQRKLPPCNTKYTSMFCGQTYTSFCKMTYLQKLSDDSNLSITATTHWFWHRHWVGEAVNFADATAANVQRRGYLSRPSMAAHNHLQLRWLENMRAHTRALPVNPCTDKQSLNKGVSVQTKTGPCNGQSRRSVSREVADWETTS